MGKTYVDTVKYLIKASFEIGGIVEKPDIVGAIFGQTEGLLGDELDLRELQKNGRIGRIEVDLQLRGGKAFGTIVVPSSLDMVETAILAGALEVVDRVGPCEAAIKVHRIEDSRNLKRKVVLDRAKDLLKSLIGTELPESKQLSEMVREEVKVSEVGTYGADKLPCGPDVESSEDIIVVEGRADVINLLKNNIKNAIAVGGAKVGVTIADICRRKEVTAFLDGDRGGDIILRELLAATDIDFVCRAPPGHEVEELSRKELIKQLRRKLPVEQVKGYASMMATRKESRENAENDVPRPSFGDEPTSMPAPRPSMGNPMMVQSVPSNMGGGNRAPMGSAMGTPSMGNAPVQHSRPVRNPSPLDLDQQYVPAPTAVAPLHPPKITPKANVAAEEAAPLKGILKELEGSLRARFLDESLKPVSEVPIRDIMKTLTDAHKVHAIVLDGIVTQRLLDLAEEKGAKYLVGIRAGNLTRPAVKIKLVLAE
ncbi:DNA primase [Candidatus Micrarchaeota archaeon]|nr:DNA primase [Candidatus Micrarchaeota archaeon]